MRLFGPREPLPFEKKKLDKKPELPDVEAASMAIACWRDLDSCRPLGFSGAGAIPYTAIDLWARRNRIDSDNFEMLVIVIGYLDTDRADRIASQTK